MVTIDPHIIVLTAACAGFCLALYGVVWSIVDWLPAQEHELAGESLEAIYAQIDRYDALISGECEMKRAELLSDGGERAKDDWRWVCRLSLRGASVLLTIRIADYSQPGSWRIEEWGALSLDPVDALATVNRALNVCAQRNLERDLDTAAKERAKQRARALIETIRAETGGESTGV